MPVADEDLRHSAPVAARHHLLAKLDVICNVDFAEHDILLRQQALGPLAVRTPVRHVQSHGRPRHFELLPPGGVFARGMLSFTQPLSPPWRLNTLVKPRLSSARAALAPL